MVFAASDYLDRKVQLNLLQLISIKLNKRNYKRIRREKDRVGPKAAWDECTVDLINGNHGNDLSHSFLVTGVRAHTYYLMGVFFSEAVDECPDKNSKNILKKLCDLFCLFYIDKQSAVLLEEVLMTGAHAALLRESIRMLCKEIRKDIIPLVDAFQLPDICLGPLGRYDGNVYESYLEETKKATPNAGSVAPYWNSLVKPMLSKL